MCSPSALDGLPGRGPSGEYAGARLGWQVRKAVECPEGLEAPTPAPEQVF